MASVNVIGIRHHSPACARLVKHVIQTTKPDAVLIEGPSDFTPRINELLLDHQLPVALYSYSNKGDFAAQSWFPFLEYSPEYVALTEGHKQNAALHFIDLPHWYYRATADNERATVATLNRPPRYTQVMHTLKQRFHCDSDDTLWDHLFESVDANDHQALAKLLTTYFIELRGNDPGSEQDRLREKHMVDWLYWAEAKFKRVLVVCGGWHKPALEKALCEQRNQTSKINKNKPLFNVKKRATTNAKIDKPTIPIADESVRTGSYLVPYAFRQVDALGGYRSGMPSPDYYQQVWENGTKKAGEQAVKKIVNRIRKADVSLSTADLLALTHTAQSLARLRGHAHPLRTDLLDALQTAVIKEALFAPAPWSGRKQLQQSDHPVIRAALLALTGDQRGRLASTTPLPPLLNDVEQRLTNHALVINTIHIEEIFDRRRADDVTKAQILWQLHCLGISGIKLVDTRAPKSARSLIPALNYEELWHLQLTDEWESSLIEAAVYGATLPGAAKQRLQQELQQNSGSPLNMSRLLMKGVRAGFLDFGKTMAIALSGSIMSHTNHGELATAVSELSTVALAGFWGEDAREMLEDTLALFANRLLWLLDERVGTGSSAMLDADVQATAVFNTLLQLRLPNLDTNSTLDTLHRLAITPNRPAGLRGAALGVCLQHLSEATHIDKTGLIKSQQPRHALGDFLFGLFSCARDLATESDELISVIHGVVSQMGHEDFLVALPSLRAAFSWFPARERSALAALIAQQLGLPYGAQGQLLIKHTQATALLDAKRIEAQANIWAQQLGVIK